MDLINIWGRLYRYGCCARSIRRQVAVYAGHSTDTLLITWTIRNDRIAQAITAGWTK